MKRPFLILPIASLMLAFFSCDDQETLVTDKLSISFTLDGADDIQLEGAKLLITINNAAGDKIIDREEVSFSQAGLSFRVATLDLPPGSYSVADFFLLNENDEIIFAVPKRNTALDNTISTTHDFRIGSGAVPAVDLLLLPSSGRQSREFGYESFRVKQGKSINVAIKINDGGQSSFASGEAFILNGMDTVDHFQLAAKMNRITFAEDTGSYELVLIRNGFSRFSQIISLDKHPKPIVAELNPAFSMVVITNPNGYFAYELDGWAGDLVMDWGDGYIEQVRLGDPNDVDVVRDHQYARPGRYYVCITGELDKINTLLFSQGTSSYTDRINVERLPELWDFRFMYTDVPDLVDASNLHKIAFFVFWSTDIRQIKVSETKPPLFIELEECKNLTNESFAEMIDDVYNYALRTNTGIAFISWGYHPDPSDYLMYLPVGGTPSPETLNKMRTLQNVYNTDFGPDVDYRFGSGDPY